MIPCKFGSMFVFYANLGMCYGHAIVDRTSAVEVTIMYSGTHVLYLAL
jgi:hypothetical protein